MKKLDVDGGDISLQDRVQSGVNFIIPLVILSYITQLPIKIFTLEVMMVVLRLVGGNFDMSCGGSALFSKITATNLVLSNLSSVTEAASLMIQSDGHVVLEN